MIDLFLAQNKHRLMVHKENNIKIENIEEYKNFTCYSLCYTWPAKKIWSMTQLVHLITLVILQMSMYHHQIFRMRIRRNVTMQDKS
jgi:hypothetical protein